jgi:hypothetical protein
VVVHRLALGVVEASEEAHAGLYPSNILHQDKPQVRLKGE